MKKSNYYWLAAGIVLIAANLRLPITMIPPLLPWFKTNLGFPTSLSGVLTTIPLLIFALLSPLVARWGVRRGNVPVLLAALAVMTIGGFLRIIPSSAVLIGGTILVGIGIAGGNVLLPAVIQEYFPLKTAVLTSLYTTTMGVVAALGTGVAAPLAQGTNLALSMGTLTCITLLAFLVWLGAFLKTPRKRPQPPLKSSSKTEKSSSLWGQPLTWMIAFYFGSQSLLYYSLLTWLPSYWLQAGFSAGLTGILATVFQLSGMPLSLITPLIARTKAGMYGIVLFVGASFVVGLACLVSFQQNFAVNLILAFLMGSAPAAAFALAIVFFQRKTVNITETVQMSGIAQSCGYLLAAVGPTLTGLVKGCTNSWGLIFGAYVVLAFLEALIGFLIIGHRPLKIRA
ncbi:MFS transporter [Lactobacillus sp. DCY120]|uniref:MFS transporter n=1 Tax=Bombilactobacillus apium TaxID=2675299 RepID=A0A850R9V1_9LACO|nr:MFS transporter [Bombilactobacillus apium]NVY96166.1 MFS transporter [Bombilactobacillus apium]